MSYRPITDLWILTRCKYKDGVKRYGGYLGGFPERARVLLGASINEPVFHWCGGLARLYPYRGGFGPNDMTVDLDFSTRPDFHMDVRKLKRIENPQPDTLIHRDWKAVLIDPPYSPQDAAMYPPGQDAYPPPNEIIRNALGFVAVGGKVGIIHYILPQCPKNAKFTACVGIISGFNNRIRVFSVFERLE